MNIKRNFPFFFFFVSRWYKLSGGTNESREPVTPGGRIDLVDGVLSIRRASVTDSGRYLCVANNSLASEPFTVTLSVLGRYRENSLYCSRFPVVSSSC